MKKLRISLSFLFLVLISLQSCKKKDVEIESQEEFDNFLSEEMESENIPGMSIVIFEGDYILYEKYLGTSNVASNTALLSNDLFLLASISKVITATALLQLYDDGLFNLDDKINDYLPFTVVNPHQAGDITFKMLLTHTSGIADGDALDSQYYYGEDSPTPLGDFLADYLVPGGAHYDAAQNYHDFAPGDEHEYSNVGNALIGLLVQEISGMNFNAYCKANIFVPLGMNNTFWRLDEITQTIVQPYNYSGGEYEAIGHYTFTDYPNGGLRSTGYDLFKLLTAFVNGGSSNGHQLLEASTAQSMYTPQIPDLDAQAGLHMFVMNAEHGLWGHDGGEQGVATIMGFNPTTKIGAIVLTNQGDANLDAIFREAYEFGTTF